VSSGSVHAAEWIEEEVSPATQLAHRFQQRATHGGTNQPQTFAHRSATRQRYSARMQRSYTARRAAASSPRLPENAAPYRRSSIAGTAARRHTLNMLLSFFTELLMIEYARLSKGCCGKREGGATRNHTQRTPSSAVARRRVPQPAYIARPGCDRWERRGDRMSRIFTQRHTCAQPNRPARPTSPPPPGATSHMSPAQHATITLSCAHHPFEECSRSSHAKPRQFLASRHLSVPLTAIYVRLPGKP